MNYGFRLLLIAVAGLIAGTAAAQPAPPLERLGINKEAGDDRLTGAGTTIAILSEAVDASHLLLADAELVQYRIRLDESGQAHTVEVAVPQLTVDEWHGTHVAGIIGASCKAGMERGIACAAQTRVHDFGAYGDFPQGLDPEKLDPETAFLMRFVAALRAESGTEIVNLSFNVEAPFIALANADAAPLRLAALLDRLGVPFDSYFARLPDLLAKRRLVLVDAADADALDRLGRHHNDPPALVYGLILPTSAEWQDLALAVAQFQFAGGVIVISESNNRLEGRSGVLNALPAIESTVDPDRWLSVVYVQPDNDGGYHVPLNGCGVEAQAFCIAVRADDVLAPAAATDGLRAESGHSMAAPMVSGLLAIMVEAGRRHDPHFGSVDAVRIVRDTARRDFPGYDPVVYGVGLLDAKEALRRIGGEP